MTIKIIKNGIYSTVQDLGRFGFRRYGINPGGAMDKRAVRLLNTLLGNGENDAVLEMYFPASELRFGVDTCFALGGADFGAELDGEPVKAWRVCRAAAGQKLQFSEKRSGNLIYFAACGGINVEKWLGSSSTNLQINTGGFYGRRLQIGDVLQLGEIKQNPVFDRIISRTMLPPLNGETTILRYTEGAESNKLSSLGEEILRTEAFSVTRESNRMGYRLTGKDLKLSTDFELVSSAVDFGTIQLLPDGQIIILMADHQTTGGYPRIGHVISSDHSALAQLGAGSHIRFEKVSLTEAESINFQFEYDFRRFRLGCELIRNI